MRDPKRIQEFCNRLAEIWSEQCPDWRFGQLFINMCRTLEIDPFYVEEDELMDHIERYFRLK